MSEIQIKFLVDHTTKETAPRSFKAGETLKCNEASAAHFIRRGLADEVERKARGKPAD